MHFLYTNLYRIIKNTMSNNLVDKLVNITSGFSAIETDTIISLLLIVISKLKNKKRKTVETAAC